MIQRGGSKKIKTRMHGDRVIGKVYRGGQVVYRRAWLNVTPSLAFAPAGQSQALAVDCPDGLAWTLSGLPAGWSASASSGTGPVSVTVTATNRTVASALTGSLTVTGGNLSAVCAVSQGAGSVSYTLVLNPYTTPLPASGGSATVTGTYKTFWNGVNTATENNVVCGLSGSQIGFSISSNVVTASSRGTEVGDARTISGTAYYGNASAPYAITQEANNQTLNNLTLACVSSNMPTSGTGANSPVWVRANGGTITATVTGHYTYTSGDGSAADVTSGSTFTYNGGIGSYSGNVFTFPSAGTTVTNDTYTNMTSVSYGGKATEYNMGRQANVKTLQSLSAWCASSSNIPVSYVNQNDWMAASGGYFLFAGQANYGYSSGSTSFEDVSSLSTLAQVSGDATEVSLAGNRANIPNWGSRLRDDTYRGFTLSYGGVTSNSVATGQQYNRKTYSSLNASLWYYDISSSGGSSTPYGGQADMVVTWTSGHLWEEKVSASYSDFVLNSGASWLRVTNSSTGEVYADSNSSSSSRTGSVRAKVSANGESIYIFPEVSQDAYVAPVRPSISVSVSLFGNTLTYNFSEMIPDAISVQFMVVGDSGSMQQESVSCGPGVNYGEHNFYWSQQGYPSYAGIYSVNWDQMSPVAAANADYTFY